MQKMKSAQKTKWIQAGEHSVFTCVSQRFSVFRLRNRHTKPMYVPLMQCTGKNLCENKTECTYKKQPTVQGALQEKCWQEGQK